MKHDCQRLIRVAAQKWGTLWQQKQELLVQVSVGTQEKTSKALFETKDCHFSVVLCALPLMCLITTLCVAAYLSRLSALVSFLEAHCRTVLLLL